MYIAPFNPYLLNHSYKTTLCLNKALSASMVRGYGKVSPAHCCKKSASLLFVQCMIACLSSGNNPSVILIFLLFTH